MIQVTNIQDLKTTVNQNREMVITLSRNKKLSLSFLLNDIFYDSIILIKY